MIGTAWFKQHSFQHGNHVVKTGILIEKGSALRAVLFESCQSGLQFFLLHRKFIDFGFDLVLCSHGIILSFGMKMITVPHIITFDSA